MIAILVAHSLDLLTFIPAVAVYGIDGEGNPLARIAYNAGGLWGVVALKLAGLSVVFAVLSGLPDSTGRSIAIAVIAGMGLLGACTNIGALWLAR